MACKGCGRKARMPKHKDVMGGYKYLTSKQINSRLEVYKRRFCRDCADRYECDFPMYQSCTKR